MKSIYLVRHGRTLFNLLNKVQGISDTPLTAEGLKKAAELGERFKNNGISFDAAYTSDLSRTRKTSQILLSHSANPELPLFETPCLREVSFGMFEGDPNDFTWRRAKEASGIPGLNGDSPDELRIQGLAGIKKADKTGLAESYEDVKKRIEHILDVFASSEGSTLLAVSHGMYINCVVYTLMEKGTHLPPVPNTSVTKLIFDHGTFRVDYVGREDPF
ncbi:histidine phosphatase family protein [Sporolactobacillus sp. THM19-2]|uniref:histidine phosphatase family protein n=1 Tax=Sporolactobacillus sp. THM19-2 TaxID=2511171 RepID=UPI001021C9D6|nr:histidine phosphatase family protein [Sporolactobacillus sp. THM19-2]RYL91519.1 histidine phosphatase family protein [Sporolactobacillus sp. THM19-2]